MSDVPHQGTERPARATRAQIEDRLVRELAARLSVPVEQVDPTRELATYGLPSVEMVGLVGELEAMVGRELSATLVWEYPTIEAIAEHLSSPVPAGPVAAGGVAAGPAPATAGAGGASGPVVGGPAGAGSAAPGGLAGLAASAGGVAGSAGAADQTAGEPIAVIGIGCRLPGGADGPAEFWRLLCTGWDAVTEVPPDRWSIEEFTDEDPEAPGKTSTRWGGFLDGVDRFDPQFFGIAPREAERMDPQQRLLAEVAWEAIEDAGLAADQLAGSSTGVFVGIATNDYALLQLGDYTRIDAHYGTGNAASIAANRLSYLLDLHGPSLAVDTACSSSLVAVHQACASLAAGDCTLALAGGVNLILSPALAINFTKAGAMAADGRCKPFDARADGYVRAEGAGIVVLKPLRRAIADGDQIYGVILGGAVNQDGRTNGLMAPNPHAQEAVLRAAYAKAGVAPAAVRYVEAHGTGTLLGDPIEVKALAAVVARDRDPAQPCLIGSVKSNVGHLEAAAGIAGLIKTLLVLRHRTIPPTIHYERPNPHIPFADLALRVADTLQPFPGDASAIAGVSSFGFGGTNAHLVLAGPPEHAAAPSPAPDVASDPAAEPPRLLALSARGPEALRELAVRYEAALGQPGTPLSARSLTMAAALRRTHHEQRLACVGSSLESLREALGAFGRDEERPGLSSGARLIGRRPKVAFVFAGQGARWWPLGTDLLDAHPVVREVLGRCDTILRELVDWSLLDVLTGTGSELAEPEVAQPALCAVQVALAELWRAWGVQPATVIGHSVGEIAAGYVAGALTLEDALRVAVHRGQVIGRAGGNGGMAVAGLSLAQAHELLDRLRPTAVWVAASNAPSSTVLSGDATELDQIVAALNADGVFCRRLESVTFASHSPAMQPLSVELAGLLDGLVARPGTIPMHSTATGEPVAGERLDAGYWALNLRQPVLFDPVVAALAEDGHDTFIEISPHPMLGDTIRERLTASDTSGVAVASLRREEGVRATMLAELGRLYTAGYPVDWRRVHGPAAPMVPLPRYPWQRDRYWLDDAVVRPRRAAGTHPVLGTHLVSAAAGTHHWSSRVDLAELPYLGDHRVRGAAVLPAAALLDAALVAARRARGEDVELCDVEFTRLVAVGERASEETVQLVVSPEAGATGWFACFGRDGTAADEAWRPVAKGGYRSRTSRTGAGDAAGDAARGASAEGGATKSDATRSSATKSGATKSGAAEAGDELAAARQRCTTRVEPGAYYERLRAAGLEYGPAFQGVRELWQAEGAAVARLELAAPAGGRDPYAIHPALLDACLQVLGAAVAETAETYVPVRAERFALPAGAVRPVWAYATTGAGSPADAALAGDSAAATAPSTGATAGATTGAGEPAGATISGRVVLFDADGGWAGEIGGLTLRRLGGAGGEEPAAEAILEMRWREAEPAAPEPTLGPDGAGRWLLFADQGGLADQLGNALAARAATCVTVRPGARVRRTGEQEYEIGAGRRADLAELAKLLRDEWPGRWRGVVHAWSLDAELPDQAPAHLLATAQDLGCVSVLHLVQELADGGLGDPPRLVLLTRGAQAATPGDGPLALGASAVWGLARVAAIEHAELHPTVVDLDPARPAGEVDALLAELFGPAAPTGTADQLCLRAGKRLVPELQPWRAPAPAEPAVRSFDPARDGNFRILASDAGLDDLQPTACPRRAPGPGEIEIGISAAALNFADVLKAMGLYPGLPPGEVPLGAECAGTVSAVGPGVTGYQIGDAVMAVARGSFGAYATTAEHLVVHRPEPLDDEQAAASPIAFLTALQALEHLARLEPGESVLIHSATGGVGLAALQVARRAGAEIYATAGTEAKRDLLRELGVEHVMDSRSLRFADEIMAATGGRGVDVVLNSLGGEALVRGVSVLAPGGRFVEIGKQDIYANSQLGLERLTRNRSFLTVDMEDSFAESPRHVARLFRRLAEGLASGEFSPLPVTSFGLPQAGEAFTTMLRARHTGKIVLRRTGQESVRVPAGQPQIRPDGSYLITGGLGALGLETARYLIERGARHLVLTGRSDPSPAARQAIEELRDAGATVTLYRGDVAREDHVAELMSVIDGAPVPLRGLVHAAGVLDDGVLAQLDDERLRRVLAPKMDGAWHLHRATIGRQLDFFVLYSSAAALLGSPGQGNYAAANAFLDSLAGHRHALGLPAQSIDWGPWGEIGLAAEANRGGHLAASGIATIAPPDGIAALHTILAAAPAQVAVLPLDRPKFQAAAASGLLPRLLAGLATGPAQPAPASASAGIRERMLAVEPGRRRRDVLTRHIRQTIAQVLKSDPARVATDAPLASLGFDSLMSLDLCRRLSVTLGVEVPATLAWRFPTVEAIVPFLAERMGIALVADDGGVAAPAAGRAEPPAGTPAPPPAGAHVSGPVDMPPEEYRQIDIPEDIDVTEDSGLDIEAMLLAKMEDIDAADGGAWKGQSS